MNGYEGSEGARRFWHSVPLPSLAPFLAAVFFNFGAIGFLLDIQLGGRLPVAGVAATVLYTGLLAVGMAITGIRTWKLLPAVAAFWLASLLLTRLWFPPREAPLEAAALAARMELDSVGALLFIVFGYVFFVLFIVRRGLYELRFRTEIELAREIHAAVVPPVALEAAEAEVYGRSLPATEVGGDLIDAVTAGGRLTCYLADVAGHGVPAGAVTGMVKSAARMGLGHDVRLGPLLESLNRVLVPITRPATFVTLAGVALDGGAELEYALAGHLPILLRRVASGRVERLAEGQLPLGLVPDTHFASQRVAVAPGDLLALLSDGLTEVEDAAGNELGIDRVEALLAAHGGEPLPRLFERLLAAVAAHGRQRDDQSLLLVRVGPPGAPGGT